MLLTLSGISMEVRDLHPLKHQGPRRVRVEGRVTEVREEQPLKHSVSR